MPSPVTLINAYDWSNRLSNFEHAVEIQFEPENNAMFCQTMFRDPRQNKEHRIR